MNLRLRTAILDAKAVSMPKDNIERAVKKGTGELDGGNVDEIVYEGYGPGGVAVMCDIMTDNRNRTAPEIRKVFEVHGGKLGGANCVGWMFERKGLFVFPADKVDEDKLMEVALEAGADDVKPAGDKFEVTCDPDRYSQVADALTAAGLEPETKELTRHPDHDRRIERRRRPPDAEADGSLGRPRRRAKRLGQLQHLRRSHGGIVRRFVIGERYRTRRRCS